MPGSPLHRARETLRREFPPRSRANRPSKTPALRPVHPGAEYARELRPFRWRRPPKIHRALPELKASPQCLGKRQRARGVVVPPGVVCTRCARLSRKKNCDVARFAGSDNPGCQVGNSALKPARDHGGQRPREQLRQAHSVNSLSGGPPTSLSEQRDLKPAPLQISAGSLVWRFLNRRSR